MDKETIKRIMTTLRITQRELAGVCGLRTETVNRKLRNPTTGDLDVFRDSLIFLVEVRRYELAHAADMLERDAVGGAESNDAAV